MLKVETYAQIPILPVGNKNQIRVFGKKRWIAKTKDAERWVRQASLAFVQNATLNDKAVPMGRIQKAVAEYCDWDRDRKGEYFIPGVALTVNFKYSHKNMGIYKRSDLDNLLNGVLNALKVNRSGWGLIKDDRYIVSIVTEKFISSNSKKDFIMIKIENYSL